jgi:hypothetical protein
MFNDPIVEEVRKHRQEHAEKFNYNLDAIYNDLKAKEVNSKRTVVIRSPKLFLKATGT